MDFNFTAVSINKYSNVLNNLLENVPENYEKKKDIEFSVNNVLTKIKYSAPEIIIDKFADYSLLIISNLPKEDCDWAINSWNKVLETHKEIKNLYKIYND